MKMCLVNIGTICLTFLSNVILLSNCTVVYFFLGNNVIAQEFQNSILGES